MKIILDYFRLHIFLKITKPDSFFRNLFKSFYMILPTQYRKTYLMENILSLFGKYKKIRFITIGANDGIHADPIYKYIKNKNWEGILIEPNKPVFDKLMKNYRNNKNNLQFENIAIGKTGYIDLYWCEELSGVSSTNFDHVFTHTNGKFIIKKSEIKMIEFNDFISNNISFSDINILLIDTEGWDAKIIESIDFNFFKSDIIIFENSHINNLEYYNCVNYLKNNNYVTYKSNQDSVAIYTNSKFPGINK